MISLALNDRYEISGSQSAGCPVQTMVVIVFAQAEPAIFAI